MPRKRQADIPAHVRAVLASLSFSKREPSVLSTVQSSEWPSALAFCDGAGLTIPLYLKSSECLPPAIRALIEQKLRDNAERWNRLKKAYGEIASALAQNGIEFAVLKGFSQWPLFVGDPRHRTQYDIDLLFQQRDLDAASAVAAQLGFEPAASTGKQPIVDHLPTLIRKTGWMWRGDYFDPDIPFSLELHFRCWDRETEGFGPSNLEELFWTRLSRRTCEELSFESLHPADSVLYASLHMLRHLFRGNLRPYHVYECAWLLERGAKDEAFWKLWHAMFTQDLRDYQAVCFALAQQWFSCTIHPVAEDAIRSLPENIARWIIQYSHSPLAGQFKSNKDELWLHLSLVKSQRQRLKILRRRLLPGQLPGPVSAVHLPAHQLTFKVRIQRQWTYVRHLWQRTKHHLASLIPTSVSAAMWIRDSWRGRSSYRRAQKL